MPVLIAIALADHLNSEMTVVLLVVSSQYVITGSMKFFDFVVSSLL